MKLFLLLVISFNLFAVNIEKLNDYNQGLKKAKIENKLLYVLISSEKCKWCKKFKETTLTKNSIKNRLSKEFIVIELIVGQDVIDEKFKTTPIPRHYFLNSKNKIIYEALGYRDSVLFDSFMDNAQERNKKNNLKKDK